MTGTTCWNFAHSGHPEGNPRWGDQFRPRDLFHLPPDDHGAGGAFGTGLRWRGACDLGHTFKSFKGQRVGNSLGLTYVFLFVHMSACHFFTHFMELRIGQSSQRCILYDTLASCVSHPHLGRFGRTMRSSRIEKMAKSDWPWWHLWPSS